MSMVHHNEARHSEQRHHGSSESVAIAYQAEDRLRMVEQDGAPVRLIGIGGDTGHHDDEVVDALPVVDCEG